MKTFAVSIAVLFIWTACGDGNQPIIDREALVAVSYTHLRAHET